MEYYNEQPPTIAEIEAERAQAHRQVQEILTSDKTNFAKFILQNDDIPSNLKEKFPIFCRKVLALSNIQTPQQLEKVMLGFRIAELDLYDYAAPNTISAEDMKQISQLETNTYLEALRSMGGRDRERAQFQTAITAQERPGIERASGGILQRFKDKIL